MRENFPSMRVSVRMYQTECVSRRMRETWKVWFDTITLCHLHVIVSDVELSYVGCTFYIGLFQLFRYFCQESV